MLVRPPAEVFANSEVEKYTENWRQRIEPLRTSKWPIFDFGTGLIACAITIWASVMLLRIRTLADILDLQTPRSRRSILRIFSLSWTWFVCAIFYAHWEAGLRVILAPWERPIDIIDIIGLPTLWVMGLAILISTLWIVGLSRAQLPVSLWIWRRDAPISSWSFSVCAAISLSVMLYFLVGVFRSGPFVAIPAIALWAYGSLAIRAAGISQFIDDINSPQTV